MKISGWIWLIVGIIMIAYSMFIENLNKNSKLTLFLYAGGLFIAIGIFRLTILFITKEKSLKNKIKTNHDTYSNQRILKQTNTNFSKQSLHKKKDSGLIQKFARILDNDLAKVDINNDLQMQKLRIEQQIKQTHNKNNYSNTTQQQNFIPNFQQKPIQVKICPTCKTQNAQNANFCVTCGARLR